MILSKKQRRLFIYIALLFTAIELGIIYMLISGIAK